MNLRNEYASNDLDRVFVFFMKSYLRALKNGFLSLKADIELEDDKDNIVKNYIAICIKLIIDSQPPNIIEIVLEAEYAESLKLKLNKNQLIQLGVSKRLAAALQKLDAAAITDYSNLWGRQPELANAYYIQTFLPNMPQEFIEQEGMAEIVRRMPQEMKKPNDY